MSEVCLYTGEALRRYSFGGGHPFGPDRLDAFWHEALRQGLEQRVRVLPPAQASDEVLASFHSPEYLSRLRRLSVCGSGFLDCGDTPAYRGIYEAAAFVVGTTLDGCERLMRAECRRVFIPIAGLHHGRRDAAAGFCALNDCGVAIETLRARHGLERIGYVDIDAHHGDGVYYGFEDDPHLYVADLHEDGRYLYPGTGHANECGRGPANGTKLNIPMPPGAGDAEFLAAWPRVEEHLRRARPQFILFQCGADSIAGDQLTHLSYTEAAHVHATRSLCRIADRLCAGRLLVMGGGGYNRANLARTWTAVLNALIESL